MSVVLEPLAPVESALDLAVQAAANPRINHIEAIMAKYPQVDCPIKVVFTPGLCSRQCFVPAGTFLTSKIHKTEHQFNISQGDISVWTEREGVVRLKAPHSGITQPGTRRVLYAHTDTIWTTYHPTNKTTMEEVEEEIIHKHDHFPQVIFDEAVPHLIQEDI